MNGKIAAAPDFEFDVQTLSQASVKVDVYGLIDSRNALLGMFGSAGAVLFAESAALTKQLTTLISQGWSDVFTTWIPYALVATGVVGLFLIQSSFHAGPVTASQAAITLVDPIVSVVLGIYLFNDHLDTAGWRLPVEVASIVVVVAGVMVLCTSPLVAGAKDESGAGDDLVRQPRRRRPPGQVVG